MRFKKKGLTIQNIGRQRFWTGIFTGFVTATILSLLFNYFREFYRLQTGISTDLLILEDNELLFFNFFFTSLASVLGLSVSIWIWMSNPYHHRIYDRLYKQLSGINAILVFWTVLMVMARFGSIPANVLYGMAGYDNHFNLFEEYSLLFVLFPVMIFLQSWASVRIVYRAGKWILFSFVFCMLTSIFLTITTTVNQDKINDVYYKKYEKDYQYINEEIAKAEAEYGLRFDGRTISVLKKWHSENSEKQVRSIQSSFAGGASVSLDSIILEKIIIRNFKEGGRHSGSSLLNEWPYALPNDILKQIQFSGSDENKLKALFEVLAEEINLVNASLAGDWEATGLTDTKRRKAQAGFFPAHQMARKLKAVKDSLLNNGRYTVFAMELPGIEQAD